jgi:hypothetical protein
MIPMKSIIVVKRVQVPSNQHFASSLDHEVCDDDVPIELLVSKADDAYQARRTRRRAKMIRDRHQQA